MHALDALRARDPDAWERLYRDAYPVLLRFAGRRSAQAEEAVMEAMSRAIEHIGSFRPQGTPVVGWLVGILRNVLREHDRRERRVEQWSAQEPHEPLADIVRREDLGRVRAAFAQLRDDERELLELRVLAGLDAAAVGRLVGKRPGAVRTAQSRALARLRELLGDEVTA